jgi:hypothetical protein
MDDGLRLTGLGGPTGRMDSEASAAGTQRSRSSSARMPCSTSRRADVWHHRAEDPCCRSVAPHPTWRYRRRVYTRPRVGAACLWRDGGRSRGRSRGRQMFGREQVTATHPVVEGQRTRSVWSSVSGRQGVTSSAAAAADRPRTAYARLEGQIEHGRAHVLPVAFATPR